MEARVQDSVLVSKVERKVLAVNYIANASSKILSEKPIQSTHAILYFAQYV